MFRLHNEKETERNRYNDHRIQSYDVSRVVVWSRVCVWGDITKFSRSFNFYLYKVCDEK